MVYSVDTQIVLGNKRCHHEIQFLNPPPALGRTRVSTCDPQRPPSSGRWKISKPVPGTHPNWK